jgi:hypothetical protein
LQYFGIDTVKVLAPAGTTKIKRLPGERFDRKWPLVTEVGGKVWIEGSLARAIHGDNYRPLPIELVGAAVLALIERAHVHLPSPIIDLATTEVTRLDIALDHVDVDDEIWTVWAPSFATLLRTDRFGVHPFRSGSNPVPSTVTVGNGEIELSAYRKDYKHKDVPPGTVRVEARIGEDRLRSKWAANNGGHVRYVTDITHDRAADLHRATCDELGALKTYGRPADVTDLILRDPKLSDARKRTVLGEVHAAYAGHQLGHASTTRKIYKELDRIGIHPSMDPATPLANRTVRLDWDRGFGLEREEERDFGLVRGTPAPG